MYPRIPQPLMKTVIRTKSPITTSKPDISLKTPDTSQSKNKLHSSHSSHSPTPTKTHLSSSASKAKNPQDVLKSWYSSNNSTTAYGKSPARINASPITGMSTEQDLREYKSLTNRTPNKSPMRMRQIGGQSDSRDDQENLNYLSFSSRKVDGYTSSSRNRENNDKSVHLSDFESENLKKHLNSDMRISLGNYVLQKLTGRILKKAAMKKLAENMEHKKGEFQEKLFKLIALAAEADADRKDRKKVPELFDFQDEEILTETGTYNSKDTIGVNSVPIESVDRRHVDPTRVTLDKYKNQKMSKGQSHSALPTESTSTERSSRTAEDWAELFLKKVEMDTKKDKNLVKQEPVGNRKVQQKKSRDPSKAAIVIQRAFRRYVKRVNRNKVQTLVQNQPVKIEKVNIQERKGSSPITEKRLSSSGMIEQLATELDLAKKKMSYLQKENETLEEKVKKMESEIDKRVNERLTIERARIKDTLSEYSSFIDKLLSEKKQLEEKAADQAKLITELCARLENKPAAKSLKELEDTLTEIEAQKLKEKQEENNRLGEYQSIVKEKEALKTKLSARVLEPLIDFNTSKRINDSNSRSFEHENRINSSSKPIGEQSGNPLNRSASTKKVNANDENRQGLHKGSFGGPEEKDYYRSVPNETANLKPLPELCFSPQVPGTESRKNSEQSQAESAKFMYNSYNQESSSLLTGLADKKGQEFMFMSADTRTSRQNQDSKVRKNRGEMKSAERDIKSARDELEFSFEAKNNVKDEEDDFSEPFVLSVALQDRSPRKNLSIRSVSQEPKPSQEAQSLITKPETKKNIISEKETKHARDRLQIARMEKRKAKEQSEEEELVPELDNLIANLSKRLYIEEGNEGVNIEKSSGNPSISKSSSSELHNEGGEALNKSENVFQRLSRSNQKG